MAGAAFRKRKLEQLFEQRIKAGCFDLFSPAARAPFAGAQSGYFKNLHIYS